MAENLENTGGDGGGVEVGKLLLKRSELAVLRRMANKFPFTEGERVEVVDHVMDVLRTSKSRRHRLSAAKTAAVLEKVNVDELKMYLTAKSSGQPTTVTNNSQTNIVLGNMTLEQKRELLTKHRQLNGQVPHDNRDHPELPA